MRFRHLASLFTSRALDARMDEEIAEHLKMQVAEHERRGMDPKSARYAALRDFGGVERAREAHRAARSFAWLDALRQDVLYARRTLTKSPGFALSAILILALAIGANTSLFTFVNGYLLKPIAINDPDRIYEVFPRRTLQNSSFLWSLPDYRLIAERNQAFSDTYAHVERNVAFLDPEPKTARVSLVSGNYMGVLGGRAILGRPILPEDDRAAGRDAVVVLSVAGWQRFFGGRPDVIGKTVRVHRRVFTVVGVMDPQFSGTVPVIPDAWCPIAMHEDILPDVKGALTESSWVFMGGLLKRGVSPAEAKDRLTSLVMGMNPRHTPDNRVLSLNFTPKRTYVPLRPQIVAVVIPVLMLFAVVLLIACADLANLLLARAAARQREIAVRLAMGASRARLIRQLLTESMVLSLVGGLAGFALAQWSISRLQNYAFSVVLNIGYSMQPLTMDWRVFLFTGSIGALAGIVFGLAPALEATKLDLSSRMKQDSGAVSVRSRPRRITDVLVGAQVAASLVLLVLAGLLMRNAQIVAQVKPGYDIDAMVDVRFDGPLDKLIDRLRHDPAIAEYTQIWRTPLYGSLTQLPGATNGKSRALGFNYVDDRYFRTLDIPIRSGRGFLPTDLRADARVVIVSESTARELWPGANAIGQVIQAAQPHEGERYAAGSYEVIGVAGDVVSGFFFQGVNGIDPTSIYFPIAPGDSRDRSLLVRARGDSAPVMAGLRRTCADVDRASSCDPIALRSVAWLQVFPYVIASDVASGIGVLALVFTCIGLYGVVAFSVVERSREIGIRMALGATGMNVVRLVLRRSLWQVGGGLAVGLPVSFALSKYTVSVVPVLRTFEPVAYTVTPVLLVFIAMLASYLPARRATSVDPMVVLRDE